MDTTRPIKSEKMKPSTEGFTLIEVMIVLTIIGIIAAIAVPNFLTWAENNRLRAASQELLSDMQHAKSEAIKRNRNVVIVFAPVGCAPTVPTPGGGYTIFVDDGSGAGGVARNNVQDGTEPVLRQVAMRQGSGICAVTVAGNTTGFIPTGRPIALNSGSVTLQNGNGRSYTLTLGIAGNLTL